MDDLQQLIELAREADLTAQQAEEAKRVADQNLQYLRGQAKEAWDTAAKAARAATDSSPMGRGMFAETFSNRR